MPIPRDYKTTARRYRAAREAETIGSKEVGRRYKQYRKGVRRLGGKEVMTAKQFVSTRAYRHWKKRRPTIKGRPGPTVVARKKRAERPLVRYKRKTEEAGEVGRGSYEEWLKKHGHMK